MDKRKIPWTQERKDKRNSKLIGQKRSKETIQKMRECQKGDKSHRWKGGITKFVKQLRQCYRYRLWRSDVFTRDNFTCQKCGDNKGGNLEAHHIKELHTIIEEYNLNIIEEADECEELWNINNGKTICIDCHKNIHLNKNLTNK